MERTKGMSRRSFVTGGAAALIGAAALGSMAGCAPKSSKDASATNSSSASSNANVKMTAGNYSATVDSIKGAFTVNTTVNSNAITSITVKAVDTKHVLGTVVSTMIPAIVAKQSLEVDTISGATHSSTALKEGVRACLQQAGAADTDFAADCKTQSKPGADETWDAVVVGSGGAGLSSAIQLAKRGVRVVLLERQGFFGGTTSFSSGGVWTMGGTEFNQATGFDYTPDTLVDHMYNASGAQRGSLNDDLIKHIAQVAGPVYTEYHKAGSPWETKRFTLGDPLKEMPVSWPIMFFDADYENNAGMTLIDFLVRHAQENGVDMRLNSQVTGLVADGGSVAGVEVSARDKTYTIKTNHVIMATGGFQRNKALVEELAPQNKTMVPFTSAGSQGDAITFARTMDAATAGTGVAGSLGLNESIGYCGTEGVTTYATTLRVNKEGKRFANEAGHYTTYPAAVCSQPDGICYGIVDSANKAVDAVKHLVDRGLAAQADTLDALASAISVPADALKQTVDAYNADAAAGRDDTSFGVPNASMTPATMAPFFAIPTHLVSFACIAGLKADANCNIVKSDGSTIKGLFGAGEVIAGNLMSGTYTGSGSQIGPSMYEGYIIAEQVAKEIGA